MRVRLQIPQDSYFLLAVWIKQPTCLDDSERYTAHLAPDCGVYDVRGESDVSAITVARLDRKDCDSRKLAGEHSRQTRPKPRFLTSLEEAGT